MKKKIILQLLFFLFSAIATAQDFFPGGVVGAEAWYIVKYSDLDAQLFPNIADNILNEVVIKTENPNYGVKSLFNFNHAVSSVNTGKLSLYYNIPFEINTARNMFFVGEPKDNVINYAHITTLRNQSLPTSDSLLITNRIDLAAKNAYFNKRLVPYTVTDNAYINFYHWNMYQTERKFKSYGLIGETTFYIGKTYTTPSPPGITANDFSGNFPEFISFPFELNANQKNRVESYLALKYGITLSKASSYRSSKNIVFWNSLNSGKFGERIFGIGRDNISGLNQLQSESVKAKNYLVASVGQLETTNLIKQGNTVIPDENFIVFGDNAAVSGLDLVNTMNVQTLKRKWLSQSTNVSTQIPMYFKLSTLGSIKQTLATNPSLKLWMLHDKFVNNSEISNFTSQYVEYYETASPIANDFGNFANVIFDPDKGTYDQFTFGVGPKMIVQVRFDPKCSSTNIKSYIVITGGTAPYTIKVKDKNGSFSKTYTTSNNTYIFTAPTSDTYTIEVTDSAGNTQIVTIDISSPNITVDLGPDKILSATIQQVTLNADQATDLTATYKWYRNGVLLEEYQSTLLVTEPGTYKVEVMSGNRMCQQSDTVIVKYNFTATVVQVMDCDKPYGVVNLKLSGGTPPYTTVISGTGQTIYQVHNSANINFSNVGFGSCTVTTTDSNNQVVQKTIIIKELLSGIELNLLSQLQQNCLPFGFDNAFWCTDVVLNAGALVTNPNVTYEWFMNGNSLNIYTSSIVTAFDSTVPVGNSNEFQVKVKNLDTGCIATEIFRLSRTTGIKSSNSPAPQKSINTSEENNIVEKEHISISSKVYPNPSESGATFYYEVFSEESFDGVIEIYSPTGALIQQETISGESAYTVPFSLSTSGVYFIYTKTNGILLTDKIIIN